MLSGTSFISVNLFHVLLQGSEFVATRAISPQMKEKKRV